ncbi:LysR family transcriptional regulator [Pseudoalteromonas rubra]|uniref:LysR family transcriptional regulator n=1 Tax=Pseudoalteromonas rubra TaxID=43658 RepID=A0A5S3WVR6_9GAMM|nr:LysR family transcriptional regulator [Pseudoalteromonas rubra]TMP34364.1 LysR family transcriptional regulator [Pseudoalteromonas rubra]
MNINTLDLNLLKVFNAIYQYRNVSKAADSIGLAQSSMSNALSRLRRQFDDPLFQRSAGGVIPTTRADDMAPQVQAILANINSMIAHKAFDPTTAKEQIVIAASDLAITSLTPALISKLRACAPGITLNFVQLDKQIAFDKLDNDSTQIVIGTFKALPARFYRKHLWHDRFIAISSKRYSTRSASLSLEKYLESPHVLMTLKGDQTGVIDEILKQQGLTRTIAMTCAQFLPLVETVAHSDLIATVPASLSDIAKRAGCETYPLPFDTPGWDSELVVTQKFYTSELGKFLIRLILDT